MEAAPTGRRGRACARRCRPDGDARRIRVSDGPERQRQVHVAEHHRRAGPPDEGLGDDRREGHRPDHREPVRGPAPRHDRLHLPELQPDPVPLRGGECRAPADVRALRPGFPAAPRDRSARPRRPLAPCRPPAHPDVGRRAAAHCYRPFADREPQADPGRRAHRQPRSPHRRDGRPTVARPVRPPRRDRGRQHARPHGCRGSQPGRPHAGRSDRRPGRFDRSGPAPPPPPSPPPTRRIR